MQFGVEEALLLVDPTTGRPMEANSVSATDGSRGHAGPASSILHSGDEALESLLGNRESTRSVAADVGAHRTATGDSGHRHDAINRLGHPTLTRTRNLGGDRHRRPDDCSRIGPLRSERPVADGRGISPLPHPGRHPPGRVRRDLLARGHVRCPGRDLESLPASEHDSASALAHPMVDTVEVHLEKFGDAEYVATGLRRLLDAGNGAMRQRKALTQGEIDKTIEIVGIEFFAHESF